MTAFHEVIYGLNKGCRKGTKKTGLGRFFYHS